MWPLKNEIAAKGKLTNEAVFAILIALFYVAIDEYLYSKSFGKKNLLLIKKMGARLKRKVEKKYSTGAMASMCILSMRQQVPVQITLKNRKVYIGLILDLPNLNPANKMQKFINILPLQSYTRDIETLAAPKKVTDYSVLLELIVLMKAEQTDPLRATISTKAQNLINRINPTVLENIDTGIAIDMDEIVSISLWDRAIAESFKGRK